MLQERHAGRVLSLGVSADGLLATTSEDRSLKIWSLRDRMLLRTFRDSRLGYFSNATWRSDGLLLGTEYRGAVAVDMLGRPDIPEKSRSVVWVERPWGSEALPISTYRAGFTQLVLGQTTHQLEVPDKHYPGSIALAPDDSIAATFSGQTLLVWTLTGGDSKPVMLPLDAKNGRARGPAVGPRGEAILVGQVSSSGSLANPSPSKTLLLTRSAAGLESRELAGPKQFLTDVAVSPDGRLGVAASYGELVVFDLPSGQVRWRRAADRMRVGHGSFSVDLSYEKAIFTRDSAMLVVARVGGSVLVFDARNGRLQSELGTEVRRAAGAFYTGADEIAATGDERLVFWSTKTGRVTRTEEISGEASLLGSDIVVTEADELGTSCDSGNADWHVERWNGTKAPGPEPDDKDWKDPRKARWHWPPKDEREDRCIPKSLLAFSPSLGLAVTSNDELDIKKQVTSVTRLGTKSRVPLSKYAELFAIAPQFSPRGDYVAATTGSGMGLFNSLIVWDAKSGRIVKDDIQVDGDPPPAGGTQFKGVHRFAFSASGRHIALVYGHWVSIRTFPEAKELARITLSASAESMLALDDDGRAWLFGSSDGGLTRVAEGKIAAQGKSSDGSIKTLSLSPDKKSVVTVNENGSLGVWDLEKATLRATLASFDDGESIAYTPAGAYAGSYEVSDRVGWVFDQPLEGFRFEQFETSFRKPELVSARLAGGADDVPVPAVRP
ncbi:MAG TPA: WD40 repeat domain-containing protein, partial [Polyangiaceae bacterium]|nr:WD40 repeat domain-containing protein [Polyangiaceae bacterium]